MDCISSFDSMTKLIAALLALIPYDGMTGGYKKKTIKSDCGIFIAGVISKLENQVFFLSDIRSPIV